MRSLKNIVMIMSVAIFCLLGMQEASAQEPVIADISKWQGDINWNSASKDLDFVIIRTQDGNNEDTNHVSYEKSAKKYDIPFGVYAYARYTTKAEAEKEAINFYNRASKDTKFYVVDVEAITPDFINSNMVNNTMAFITKLKTISNKPVGLYTGDSYYSKYGLKNVTNRDFLWIARYGNNDDQAEDWEQPDVEDYDLWQYTSQGSVLGISGNVDLNKLGKGKTLNTFFRSDDDVTTASSPNYYRTNPKKIVITKNTANTYKSTDFYKANVVKTVKKNTILNITGVKNTKGGTPRLKTTAGTYITANKNYVRKVTSNIDQYYTTVPGRVVVQKDAITTYNSAEFSSNSKVGNVEKNKVLEISDIEYTRGGTPRLKTTAGTYITANRNYVKKVTSNIDQYYTIVPAKVVVQKDNATVYNNPEFTSNSKLGNVKKNTILEISDIRYSNGGTPRLKTTAGTYITANKNYVKKVISNIEQYYTTVPAKVAVQKDSVTSYNSVDFSSDSKVGNVKKNTILEISDIEYTNGGTPRLKTTAGTYITANKSFVIAQ
ncbi:DUF5776 domain-containing protein [Rummeliibacillus sp. NPDC094406]|uniref:DUF5776 domain-containing protein n=1 Tax=Rummeliibacillus sp. NPDC094406 TaxID=3364511 RepID=UPI0037F6382A